MTRQQKLSHVGTQTNPNFPKLEYDNARIKVKFNGSILRQSGPTDFGSIVNIYIFYRLIPRTISSNIVLKNCLLGSEDITKNADPDKYVYSGGIGTGFGLAGEYAHPDGGMGRNVIIFGADMTNSKHPNNKTKDVLVLGRHFVQKIDYTTIYAGKMYSPNFSVQSLHCNRSGSNLFVNGTEVIKFKAKYQSNCNGKYLCQICLGSISSDYNQADRNSTGLYGYVYDFSVSYDAIAVDDILDIHKYLMKKNNII